MSIALGVQMLPGQRRWENASLCLLPSNLIWTSTFCWEWQAVQVNWWPNFLMIRPAFTASVARKRISFTSCSATQFSSCISCGRRRVRRSTSKLQRKSWALFWSVMKACTHFSWATRQLLEQVWFPRQQGTWNIKTCVSGSCPTSWHCRRLKETL